MRKACDSDSRCGLACDASTCDAKSLAMCVERCEPLSAALRHPQDGPLPKKALPRGPCEASWCLAAKIDLPLSRGNFWLAIALAQIDSKMPPKLPLPHKRGLFFFFQNCPRGEGKCETSERIERQQIVSRQFLPRGIKMPLQALWVKTN